MPVPAARRRRPTPRAARRRRPPASAPRPGRHANETAPLIAAVAAVFVIARWSPAPACSPWTRPSRCWSPSSASRSASINEPGLHAKLPFVQTVISFDSRLLDFSCGSEEVILADQRRLIVDSFTRYRITDPLRFFRRSGRARTASAAGSTRS